MIDIKNKKDCCGCNACGDVCPAGAIVFDRDNEGFLYPKVNVSKCVNCGLCDKVCPQLRVNGLTNQNWNPPKAVAAVHKNLAVRFDSTSGGAFSAMAQVVFRKGGYVGGAVWTNDFFIEQIVTDDKNDLPRLRSSKYAQSDARGFYQALKSAVLTGKPVLLCGTPCQMVAVRTYLGQDYDNLIIMDFICRGNNSPKVFRKYLDWQEAQHQSKIVSVKPKNKEFGWRMLTTKLVFANGDVVYDTRETSNFTKGYLRTNAYCRPSCYDCKFKGLPRHADLTVADCWGAKGQLPDELDRDLGTSLILLNNEKGQRLFEEASKSMLSQDMIWETVRRGNPMLEKSLPKPKCDRDEFFTTLDTYGFQGVISKFIAPEEMKLSALRKVKCLLQRYHGYLQSNRFNLLSWWRFVIANSFCSIIRGWPVFRVAGKSYFELRGKVSLGGDVCVGCGFLKHTPCTTHIAVSKGGRLSFGGSDTVGYGADIEVFPGGKLKIGRGCASNIGLTIVCGDSITIGEKVMMGRHVTIRDNNGGHWMNLPGYKNSKPVEIGDHVWMCEGCTIMPGVKIGAGAVVGAKAVVFNNVPANSLVVGNPAEVVCENVEWKY